MTNDTRQKFYDAARTAYPNVGEPGPVWVLCEVLGWPYGKVKTISVDGFSRDSFRVLIRHNEPSPFAEAEFTDTIEHSDGNITLVTRKWTKREKSILKDWWWLLGL